MPFTRQVIADQLRDAARGQYPVRIERDHAWWADHTFGFVIDMSGEWVAVQRLMDAVYEDGIEVVCIADVTDVLDNRENGYIERAVAKLGRREINYALPDAATTMEVLRSAAQHSPLIRVHLEREDDDPLLVGKVVRLGTRKFDIQLIGPKGVWVNDPTRWWYKDVTRVVFGDRYSAALERFGDACPALDGT